MWFGEPNPFPERGSPTILSTSGQQRYEGWSCRTCCLHLQDWSGYSTKFTHPSTLHIKQNLCPCHKHVHKSGDIVPIMLYHSIRLRWMVSVMPQPLYPWEEKSVPTEQKAGWAPELVCKVWRTEYILLAGTWTKIPSQSTP